MSEMRGFVPESAENGGLLKEPVAVADQPMDDVPHNGEFAESANPRLAEIASLSTQRIMEMSPADMVNLIRRVRTNHLRPGMFEQLTRMDEANLRRLAFATRRYCRDQTLMLEGIFPDAVRIGNLPR